MAKIFISHSWNDNDIAKKLAESLKRDGADIWIDYAKVKGGEGLPERISEALDWCDTLLLVWSKSAAESYYVKLEWRCSLDMQKTIIPCIIDASPLPGILRGVLYIDFKNFDNGYEQLLDSIGLEIQKPEPPVEIIPKQKKTEPSTEHEKVQVTHTPPNKKKILKIAAFIIVLLAIVAIGIYLVINYLSSDRGKAATTTDTASIEDSLKTYWDQRQNEMSASFAAAQKQDTSDKLKPSTRLKTWQEFLNNYAEINPLSQHDDSLRAIAKTRMNLWQSKTSSRDSLKTIKESWVEKQSQMQADYQVLLTQESDTSLSPAAKTTLWQNFITKFQENNPFSQEDDNIRSQARDKINDWRNFKPTPRKISPPQKISSEIEYIFIPSGSFVMGDNFGDGDEDEKPVHTVTVSGFYLSKTEVTVAQYRNFCDRNNRQMPLAPDWGWNDDHPIVNVNWSDALAFCKWAGGRLPTEAEWEYAARNRGRMIKYSCGNQLTPQAANYDPGNSAGDKYRYTAPVGSFPASELGLHDMIGNAWEWCKDWYDKNYYQNSAMTNPTGPESGKLRVLRGGSWSTDAWFSRATSRLRLDPNSRNEYSGFRVARDAAN